MSTTFFAFRAICSGSFREERAAQVDWIWHGYLARGATTLLTSQWKAGKTTLLSVLLARMAAGGELAGLGVAKSKAAIVSEERVDNWRRRGEALSFADNLFFFCRPFAGRPTPEGWRALVEHLAGLRADGVELIVIDPLAHVLPGASENQSCTILDALQPLESLTATGQSVLLLHHPRKGESAPGQAARGSGALCAVADVVMEMKLPLSNRANRRRRLLAWSRFDDTPRDRLIELSDDATDYRQVVIDPTSRQDRRLMDVIEQLLACPPSMLTRLQMLKYWPPGAPLPHIQSLWRVLDGAVKTGRLEQAGSGRRGDPFRYGIPGLGARWIPDLDTLQESN